MNALLAGFLLLQESSAAETFAKIEKSLESAKTIRITFKLEGTLKKGDKESGIEKSGTLLLKQDNKAHLRVRHGENSELLVSDGKTMLMDSWSGKFQISRALLETREDLNTRVAAALLRRGPADSLAEMTGLVSSIKPEDRENHKASGFEQGNDEGAAKTLKYKVGILDAMLRYDAKTLRVFSRTLTHQDFGTVNEAFDAFTLNDPIPDSEFAVYPDILRD